MISDMGASDVVGGAAGIVAKAGRPGGGAGAAPTSVAGAEAGSAVKAAGGFLAALTDGDYGRMWDMLAPESQAVWGGPEAFAGFLERKFGGVKLSFTLGEPGPEGPWRGGELGGGYDG